MSSDSPKPVIFISYAHADEPEKPREEEIQWLSYVMKFLRPAVKYGEFRIWVDPQIPAGTPWDPDIERHLRACSVFVLLVSANSMASDYIIDKELAIARQRQATGAVQIYPLLIEATPKAGLARVGDLNLRPPGLKPLQSYALADRNQHMSDAADEIADIAKAMADKQAAASVDIKLPDLLTREFEGIAAGFKGRQSAVGPATPDELPPLGPTILDIRGLPETGYHRLVGRDAGLSRLDEAWSGHKTNILSLVAESGAGKSALVNEWLRRLSADRYRGATIVLGWSFYSPGSKERATAADEFLNWALVKLGAKVESTSATAKGAAIAEALASRRALLVLDGVERFQHGPGPQVGQLKDQGLRALLRRFAAVPPAVDHSLIVLTSRIAVADIQRLRDAAQVVEVDHLSDEAGEELLRDNDVWGVEAELRSASRGLRRPSAGPHPPRDLPEGNAERRRPPARSSTRPLSDADNSRHDQARRVIESYEEVEEIAEPGPMRLNLCDIALERARLRSRLEAFAPLNGLFEASPAPAALPDEPEAARLLEQVRKELDIARKLIAECDYRRRDEELAELDAVVAGAAASPNSHRGSETGAAAVAAGLLFSEVVHFRDSLLWRGLKMKRSILRAALACFVWMALSGAMAADLGGRYETNYTSRGDGACSCDAPGITGLVCATPRRCEEMSGLCEGACVHGLADDVACSCDAPGITGLVCATPRRCEAMSGLCGGGC